ncbi:hypothetical protein GGX14DRAFT_399888 [Mycena pura]|uniref:Uncharacterized protein n=1 Tax=Mycena pura TaxID=153505 RepID=A0AAD6V3R9_9AGAR|nr:hypothetical protein GGX14DRAFT_399888 [Mycena pura]
MRRPVLVPMTHTKSSKPKEMFKPYDAARVPDIMPFPDLARVATSKGEEAAVPALNEHQRSWILDVGIRDIDLPSLSGKAALTVYDRVKNDAFEAKAFKHSKQPGDRAEEARLPALVAAWKQMHQRAPSTAADDADSSADEGEDDGGHSTLLRGYSKAGWRSAIQKVISNRRSADSRKRKGKEVKAASHAMTPADKSAGEASALSKLLGLAAYTGRDKFRDDRHDVIYELSATLPGENAGGKFRKAEGILWAKEDQASWEEAAAVEENIDWVARQRLVPKGFKNMVENLHDSRKFRPFIAMMLMGWLDEDGHVQFEWAEAVPDDICVGQRFKELNSQLVKDTVVAMHTWVEKPLKEYVATRKTSSKTSAPIFPLSAEESDELAPKLLFQTVTTFLEESYGATFGAGDIPWASIASKPDEFYDAARFSFEFASTGLAELTRTQLYDLGSSLASVAGAGTSGFFRKAPAVQGCMLPPPPPARTPSPPPARTPSPPPAHTPPARTPSPPPSPARTPSPPPAHTRTPSPPPLPARTPSPPPVRTPSPPPPARTPSPPPVRTASPPARTRTPSPPPPHARTPSPPPPPPPPGGKTGDVTNKPHGKKRKAADQLEDAQSGRPARKRKTPAEAQAEHEEKAAAAKAVKRRATDRYEYVAKSPEKPKRVKRSVGLAERTEVVCKIRELKSVGGLQIGPHLSWGDFFSPLANLSSVGLEFRRT